MSWWATIIGGTFGYMLGGPLGALFGAAIGRNFDRGFSLTQEGMAGFKPGDRERVQSAFFIATFSVMGHIAKADGRVSASEIELARAVMNQMSLTADQKKVAIDLFNQGKQADFDLDKVLEQFRTECQRRHNLIQMFIEIQIHAAYADDVMHPDEKRLLLKMCGLLGFTPHDFAHMEAMVRSQRDFQGDATTGKSHKVILKEAYAILDVSEHASDVDVKRAYRRLMNQHHPDKLASKGLPEEMMKLATEKTQEIKAAYETVKKSRGMR